MAARSHHLLLCTVLGLLIMFSHCRRHHRRCFRTIYYMYCICLMVSNPARVTPTSPSTSRTIRTNILCYRSLDIFHTKPELLCVPIYYLCFAIVSPTTAVGGVKKTWAGTLTWFRIAETGKRNEDSIGETEIQISRFQVPVVYRTMFSITESAWKVHVQNKAVAHNMRIESSINIDDSQRIQDAPLEYRRSRCDCTVPTRSSLLLGCFRVAHVPA